MNKKILISFSIIAAVAAIAAGATGAWWTDTANSANNTFHAGSMNLQLANESGPYSDQWHDDYVEQTWDYENMVPGGDSMGDPLRLKNSGDTPADWLKITASTTPTDEDTNMDKHMRITKLAYDGESLLEGGAGANLSNYEGPVEEDCDVLVDGDGDDGDGEYPSIQSAITNGASSNNLICVRNGTYNETVAVDKEDITLATFNGANQVTLNGKVVIKADGVTFKGFKVVSTETAAGDNAGSAIKINSSGTIEYDILDASSGANGVEIGQSRGADIAISNNKLRDGQNGILLRGNTGDKKDVASKVVATNNTISGFEDLDPEDSYVDGAGIKIAGAWWSPYEFDKNVIRNNDVGIRVEQSDTNANKISANWNNIVGNDDGILMGDSVNGALNATNNYWGQVTGPKEGETVGSVDDDPYLEGPHKGFINGEDRNGNGFADLNDLYGITHPDYDDNPIVINEPKLQTNGGNERSLELQVQLDGPTAENNDMNSEVNLDANITMGQGPVEQ